MKNEAIEIIKKLRASGFKAYWAGGCVRDNLMNLIPKDYDIATDALPEKVMGLFEKTIPLGVSFGVIKILSGGFEFEVATFRSDGKYLDGRHPEEVHFSSEREDACRRDFTINGMFYDPLEGKIIDYVGGRQDIKGKVIRTINDPKDRFSEDRLRLIRAIRFAAKFQYEIEPQTYQAIEEMASTVNQVSPERIREELEKMLTGPRPADSIRLLDKVGLLKIILPEITAMKGVEQPEIFHPEGDVWVHTLLMLEKLKNHSFELAMGALLHDVGKPSTFTREDRIRFNHHSEVGAQMTEQIGKRLRLSNKQIDFIAELVRYHLRFKDVQKMRESTLKRFLRLPNFSDHLELHRMDCLASHGKLANWEFCKQKLCDLKPEEIRPEPLISGHDLMKMGYKAGPIFKKILTRTEDAHLEGEIQNREEALRFVKENFPIKHSPN
jgi:poly(A) polymerase